MAARHERMYGKGEDAKEAADTKGATDTKVRDEPAPKEGAARRTTDQGDGDPGVADEMMGRHITTMATMHAKHMGERVTRSGESMKDMHTRHEAEMHAHHKMIEKDTGSQA